MVHRGQEKNDRPSGVVFVRSNPVAPDPRVEKQARALAEEGFSIQILCWDRTAQHPTEEFWDYARVQRISIPAGFGQGLRNIPSLLKWQWAVLRWLWKNRYSYSVIHACDFDTVIPAVMMKLLASKRVVYDIFDFYADSVRGAPRWLRGLLKWIDLKVINVVDGIIIVDDSRRRQILGSRPRRLAVIYNSPSIASSFFSAGWQNWKPDPEGRLRIVYVGVLQVERGLIELVHLLRKRKDFFLHLAGFGADERVILDAIRDMTNVQFYGVVGYEQALDLARQSDVMIATYDPSIPNHRFSSANKLFEAMALGKPIVVARGTGMDELVEKYGLGRVVEYGSVQELESALEEIKNWTLEEKLSFAKHARQCYDLHFSWELMQQRLIQLYRQVGAC